MSADVDDSGHGRRHDDADRDAGEQAARASSTPGRTSLTHRFKTLREAGILRQRQYGLERRSRVRTEDLDTRFPGLLDLVAAWEPASGQG